MTTGRLWSSSSVKKRRSIVRGRRKAEGGRRRSSSGGTSLLLVHMASVVLKMTTRMKKSNRVSLLRVPFQGKGRVCACVRIAGEGGEGNHAGLEELGRGSNTAMAHLEFQETRTLIVSREMTQVERGGGGGWIPQKRRTR